MRKNPQNPHPWCVKRDGQLFSIMTNLNVRRFFVCYPQRGCWLAILDEMKEIGRFWVPSFRPRWPTNKLAGGNKRKSAKCSAVQIYPRKTNYPK